MPQLNRSIQMLQEGRVSQLNDLIPIFQSINTANTGAVNVIQRFTALHSRVEEHHRQHHHLHHQHHNQQGSQSYQNQPRQQGQQNNLNINLNQSNNNQNQPIPRPPQQQGNI